MILGSLNAQLKFGRSDDKKFGDMVYDYVLFLHMHIKPTMRNADGKLLLWLTMLNNSIHNLDGDFGKQCLLTLFMDNLLLQTLGAIGFIECSIEVWEERR